MSFKPKEILFSPTARCNLDCPHCDSVKTGHSLPEKYAIRLLAGAKKHGIDKIGFTGGEPFLKPDFLCAVSEKAVKRGLIFDRIMTNGAWFKDKIHLTAVLKHLRQSGYDGDICVSVDAFHGQDLKKVSLFIRCVNSIWNRGDMVSIAWVAGFDEKRTGYILKKLSRLLNCRITGFPSNHASIKNSDLFIKLLRIPLSYPGKASALKIPWDGAWFKDDLCKGPGQALFVMPDGEVKPCCGYATRSKELSIGNIKRDSSTKILSNAKKNRFVFTVFHSGLDEIRKRLGRLNVRFPGKTKDQCYFCRYLLTAIPKKLLYKSLD